MAQDTLAVTNYLRETPPKGSGLTRPLILTLMTFDYRLGNQVLCIIPFLLAVSGLASPSQLCVHFLGALIGRVVSNPHVPVQSHDNTAECGRADRVLSLITAGLGVISTAHCEPCLSAWKLITAEGRSFAYVFHRDVNWNQGPRVLVSASANECEPVSLACKAGTLLMERLMAN